MNIKESCKCPACSSSLVFDIVTYSLRCPGCDALYDLEKFGEDRLTKHPHRNAGKDAAPDPEVRHCTNCGAGLYPGAQSLTAACPCCKRPVRGASRSADGIMPDLVIPFSYGREDFLKAFRESCGEDPTVKDGFRLDILPESVRPVYLPFLVYDLKGTAEISVIFKDSDGVRFDRSKNFDLDLTAFPELLHDIPVKDFSKKIRSTIPGMMNGRSSMIGPLAASGFAGSGTNTAQSPRRRYLIPEKLRTSEASRIGF